MTYIALRDVFVRFTMGISKIKTHKLRYSTDSSDNFSSALCKCGVDDEITFCLCAKLHKLKVKIVVTNIYLQNRRKQLTVLNNTERMTSVERYIYHSLKLRMQQQQN